MDVSFLKNERRIKIGIWGLGRGGSFVRSARALNYDIVAGCDFNPDIREKFRANVPEAYITDNEDDFLKQDMDVVLVSTYFPAHCDHAIKVLEAGKHVMCEVTSFTTPADGVRLVEAVEKSGKIYHLLENYPFSKENMHLKKLWDEGFFGDFLYGEFEYVHMARQLSYCYPHWIEEEGADLPVRPGWAIHHWRGALNVHMYNTHSLGPLMNITGLRPVAVEAFPNTVGVPGMVHGVRASTGSSLVRMSNGGVMRNLMGSTTMDNHTGGRIWGTKAAADKMTSGKLIIAIGADGAGHKCEVTPEWPDEALGELARNAGHGGGDFWELFYFAREFYTGEKGPWNIYEASDVTLAGILAVRSTLRNGEPQHIPDFRLKEERDAYRNDHCDDFPRFDPVNGCFPEDADRELVKDFNRLMRNVFANYGHLRAVMTVVQGMRIYDTIANGDSKLEVVKSAIGLKKRLPKVVEDCRALERIAAAYPDSVGGKTITYGLTAMPLDKIYNEAAFIEEIDSWLASIGYK